MVDQFSQCYEILVGTIIKTKTGIEHSESYMNNNLTRSNGAVAIAVGEIVVHVRFAVFDSGLGFDYCAHKDLVTL